MANDLNTNEILKGLLKKGETQSTVSGMNAVQSATTTAAYLKLPLTSWPAMLREECGVYVFGEHYLAKRFDQINYRFCELDEAKEVVIDNIYALLKNKYFPKMTDEIYERTKDIVKTFTTNLKTELKKVSFDVNDDCCIMKQIPDYCVAFKNGVYNFKDNDWLFKYDITVIPGLSNRIYSYDTEYAIMWYMNYDFVPLPINIMEDPLETFVSFWKQIEDDLRKEEDKRKKNFCFELMYNMCHDMYHDFSMNKMVHLCEVLGYLVNVSFLQYFVILIGGGRNGKNSLFDGCFTSRVIPMPTQNSMVTIETDKFITGTLENKAHNIYLETNEKSVSIGSSDVLKQLTGSPYQTAEHKGKERKSTMINVKYLFSANEQEKLKFGDISEGFRRRVEMLEILFQYDPDLKYMKKNKDYYDTTFNQDLSEVKANVLNTTVFIYFAMYGILSATKNFTRAFKFTHNDWNDSYSNIDTDIRERINAIDLDRIVSFIENNQQNYSLCKPIFYDSEGEKHTALYNSPVLRDFGYFDYEGMIKMLKDEEKRAEFFSENDVYMSLTVLQILTGDAGNSAAAYTSNFKKVYNPTLARLYNNKSYVLVGFRNGGKIKIIRRS